MSTLAQPQGVFGGTFDPIHLGHLNVANTVARALSLAFVRLIPAGAPPHRPPPHFSAAQRLRFCELAAADHIHLRVDAREVHKTSPSYTIETLEQLRVESPNTPQVLILGADAFLGLHRWHRWRELLAFCHIALVARPGFDAAAQLPDELQKTWREHYVARETRRIFSTRAGAIVSVDVAPMELSATQVRAALRAGKSVRGLVCDAVADALES